MRLFAVLFILFSAKLAHAQCTPTVSGSNGLNGGFTFYAGFVGSPPSGSGQYNWSFGNGLTATQTATNYIQTSSTYTANGIYTVTLTYTNTANTCSSTVTMTFAITNVQTCSLTPAFTSIASYNGGYIFNSFSSGGTVAGTTRTWIYGDGSPNFIASGNTTTAYHQYLTPGTYTVKLILNNNFTPACIDSVTNVITVCAIPATITSVAGSGGTASFTVNSTATGPSTYYSWNFGSPSPYNPAANGTGATYTTISHTYNYNGTYTVNLSLTNPGTCTLSVTHTITISTATGGACVPNSNFTVTPTATAQVWNAYPAVTFTPNIAGATWNWGDGTSSSGGLYTSHSYSVAGNYSICLTVTVLCSYGYTSSTSCYTYAIYRSNRDMSMVQINIMRGAAPSSTTGTETGIANSSGDAAAFTLLPNPNNGAFSINVNGLMSKQATITVYDIVGKQVYQADAETSNGSLSKDIQLEQLTNGVYFIKINSDKTTLTKKVVVSK